MPQRIQMAALNDCLHAGPSFDQKILDILLIFRVHRVTVTGDVEKAFLMVSMARKDRYVLCFLWVDDVLADQPNIIELRFTRVLCSRCLPVPSSSMLLYSITWSSISRPSQTL